MTATATKPAAKQPAKQEPPKPSPSDDKPVPQDALAELDCLIRIFDEPQRVCLVSDKLAPEHFYDPANEWIFRSVLDLYGAGKEISANSVHAWLSDRELPSGKKLITMFEGTPHTTIRERLLAEIPYTIAELQLEDAAKRIREKFALRQIIAVASKVAIEAYGDVGDVEDFATRVEERLGEVVRELRDGSTDGDTLSLFDGTQQMWTDIEHEVPRQFISTGIADLDADVGGFEFEMVTVIGAGTNWGKTQCSVMFADEAALSGHHPLVVAFEDKPQLYVRRFAARRAHIHMSGLKNNRLSPEDHQRFSGFVNYASEHGRKPFVLNARGRPIENVVARVKSLCRVDHYDLIIWDYLQAMKSRERHADKRERVEHCYREVIDCTKVCKAAGIVVSQLARLPKGEEPTINNLKETGDIENGADVILLGFNDEDGAPRLRLAKSKDSAKNEDYGLVWDTVAAAFRAGSRIEQQQRRW